MRGKGEHCSLLDADDCVMVVIDVQDAFLSRLPRQDSECLLNTVCWLVVVAQWIRIPLVVTAEEIVACQDACREVKVDPKVRSYILDLVYATREHDDILLGGSPRASIALSRSAQALAAIRGNAFVLPDDVKRVAPAVLSHRIIVRPESRLRRITADSIVEEILNESSVPTMKEGADLI